MTVRARALSKVYGDGRVALSELDLDLSEGMVGLLGPNGAGKTTFLSLLVLTLEPTTGELRICGLDPSRPGDRGPIRRRIGYLPQDFQPIRRLTGLEYLVHCARLRGVPHSRRTLERRAMALLEAVDLAPAARRASGAYSGGMRRRLGIAQALVHAPTLVVVDEPTAGLDPEERIRFRNLIADVADEASVLLSTHVVEDIEATCPRVAVIAGGRLQFDGTPGELIAPVDGRLWELREAGATGRGVHPVGRRVAEGGATFAIVLADRPPPGARPVEVTLERAYSAFLADRGFRADAPPAGAA